MGGVAIARQLSDCGAMVFLDETRTNLSDEPRIGNEEEDSPLPPEVPSAISHADELLVLLSDRPGTRDARDFLVIALTVAHIRNIPVTVFLPPNVSTDAVRKSAGQYPRFLVKKELCPFSGRDEYFRGLGSRARGRSEPTHLPLGEAARLPVCLFWVDSDDSRTTPSEAKNLARKLNKYGLNTEVVAWSRRRGAWHPDRAPYEQPTALAIHVRGSEEGIWGNTDFMAFAERAYIIFFVWVDGPREEAKLPQSLRGKPSIAATKLYHPEGLYQLARGLIGFRDYRSSPEPAEDRTRDVQNPPRAESKGVSPPVPVPPVAPPASAPALSSGAKVNPPVATAKSTAPVPISIAYAVYCRFVFEPDAAADEFATAVETLQSVLDDACADGKCFPTRASIFGRFAIVPGQATAAIDLAKRVIAKCAERGIWIAVGVASGPVIPTPDIGINNYTGGAINTAARLANLKNGAGKLAIDVDTHTSAVQGKAAYRSMFGPRTADQVKSTPLDFHWHNETVSAPATKPHVSSHHDSWHAHVLVYDIIGFSKLDLNGLVDQVEKLNRAVLSAINLFGVSQLINNETGWYAPSGDGGAIVLRSDQQGVGLKMMNLIGALLDYTAESVDVRIGVATGQIVPLANNLPVGGGIIAADRVSSLAAKGMPCVSRAFWDSLDKPSRRNWRFREHPKSEFDLLIERGSFESGHGPTSSGSAAPTS